MARNILASILLYILPIAMVVVGITSISVPEDRYLFILGGSILFLGLSYIQNRYKRRAPLLPVLVALVLFAALMYYSELTLYFLLTNGLAAVVVYVVLLVHINWRSRELFLGKKLEKKVLKEQLKGRLDRIKAMELDEMQLIEFVQQFNSYSRERLEEEGLLTNPPGMGGPIIESKQRSSSGQELLIKAKDTFYAIIYGDEDLNVSLDRVHTELLTITLPRKKAFALQPFMKAVTELGGRGSWADPEGSASDIVVDNVILEVEYKDTTSQMIGNAIKSCLRLINYLEINEKILYIRMMQIEQSSLT